MYCGYRNAFKSIQKNCKDLKETQRYFDDFKSLRLHLSTQKRKKEALPFYHVYNVCTTKAPKHH